MLILTVAKDLDELLENRSMTAVTPLCEMCRIMKVTINLALVLIV